MISWWSRTTPTAICIQAAPAAKLAVLDRLRRVILVSGYSKMLAASLRVGYAWRRTPDIPQKLADLKMLAGTDIAGAGRAGHSPRADGGPVPPHAERVRARVDRRRCVQGLTAWAGPTVPREPHAGMFCVGRLRRDSEVLAREAADQALLLAPGTLFSPSQAPSSMVRFSVTMVDHNDIWAKLEKLFMPGSPAQYGQHST